MITRRDFLKAGAQSALLLAAGSAWSNTVASASPGYAPTVKGRELIVTCDKFQATQACGIMAWDAASHEVFSIDMPFCGHAVTQNHARPHQLVTFKKWGRGGALVDMENKAVIASAEPYGKNVFFGHAAFNADGSMLVTSEANKYNWEGHLVLRDASNLALIHKIPSYGERPHECRAIDEGKTLLVLNEGSVNASSNLAWIDMESGKLLHKIDMGVIKYSHVGMYLDRWIFALSGFYQQGAVPICFISPDREVFKSALPSDIIDKGLQQNAEVLSGAFLGESGLVALTIPDADMVLIFDYKSQALIEAIPVPSPTGVVFSDTADDAKPGMLVSSRSRKLFSIVADREKKATVTIANKDFGVGAHLTRMYI